MCCTNLVTHDVFSRDILGLYGIWYFGKQVVIRRSAHTRRSLVVFLFIFFFLFVVFTVAGKEKVKILDLVAVDDPFINASVTAYRSGFLASLWIKDRTLKNVNISVVSEDVNLINIASKIKNAAKNSKELVVVFGPGSPLMLRKSFDSLELRKVVAFGPYTDFLNVRRWNPYVYFMIGNSYDSVFALLKYTVVHLRVKRIGFMFLNNISHGEEEYFFVHGLMRSIRRNISAVFTLNGKKNYFLNDTEFINEWESFADAYPQAIIVIGTTSETTKSFFDMVFIDNRTRAAYLLVPMQQQALVLESWKKAVDGGTPFVSGQVITTGSNPMAKERRYKCIRRFQKDMLNYLSNSGQKVYEDYTKHLNDDTSGELMVAGWMVGEVLKQTLSNYDSKCSRKCYMKSLFAQRRYIIDDFVVGDYGGEVDEKAEEQGASSYCNQGGNVVFIKTFRKGFRAVNVEKGKVVTSLNKCSIDYELSNPGFAVTHNFKDVEGGKYAHNEVLRGMFAAIDSDEEQSCVLKDLNVTITEAAANLRKEAEEFMTDIVLGMVTDEMLGIPDLVFIDPIFFTLRPTLASRNVFYFTPTMEQYLFVMAEYLATTNNPSAHVVAHVRPAEYIFDIVRRTFRTFQVTLNSAVEVDQGESLEKYLPTSGLTILIESNKLDVKVLANHLEKNNDSQLVLNFMPFAVNFAQLTKEFLRKEISMRLLLATHLPHWEEVVEPSIGASYISYIDGGSLSPLSFNAFVVTQVLQEVIKNVKGVSTLSIVDYFYSKTVITLEDIVFGPFSDGASMTCTTKSAINTISCAKNYGATSIAVWSLARVFNSSVPPLSEGITPSMIYKDPNAGQLTRAQMNSIIVGGVFGAALLAAVVAVLLCCCLNSRDNRNAPKERTAPVTLVFTDIENSTALWAACPKNMADAVVAHHRLIRSLIKKYNCYEVKTIGDSFMIASRSVFAAVQLVRELQQEFVRHDWGTTAFDNAYRALEERRAAEEVGGQYVLPTARLDADVYRHHWNGLRVRVGVHTGLCDIRYDPVTKGYDYYGSTSNTAARTESIANGGQVLLTRAAYMALSTAERAQVNVTLLGAVALRGVPEPVQMYQLDAVPGRAFAALCLEREGDDLEEEASSEELSSFQQSESLSGEALEVGRVLKAIMSAYPAAERKAVLSCMCDRWGICRDRRTKCAALDDCVSRMVDCLALRMCQLLQYGVDSLAVRSQNAENIYGCCSSIVNTIDFRESASSKKSTVYENINKKRVSIFSHGSLEFWECGDAYAAETTH